MKVGASETVGMRSGSFASQLSAGGGDRKGCLRVTQGPQPFSHDADVMWSVWSELTGNLADRLFESLKRHCRAGSGVGRAGAMSGLCACERVAVEMAEEGPDVSWVSAETLEMHRHLLRRLEHTATSQVSIKGCEAPSDPAIGSALVDVAVSKIVHGVLEAANGVVDRRIEDLKAWELWESYRWS